jgi:hypothetical protein
MNFGRGSRRSIRYSIFIGVLAGSVFSGSGAFAVDPTPITNQAELENIGGDLAGSYYLDFTETELELIAPTNNSTYITGIFTGTLDGRGKTLSGLTAPLFDTISGEVKDLNLATEILDGVVGNGALANTLDSIGIVNSVTVTGNVDGSFFSYVGGLVGSSSGTIIDSTVNGNVNGNSYTGGLVGSSSGSITGSYATGSVDGSNNVGGLVGYSEGAITNSHATGDVTGSGEYIGGLVGWLEEGETISNSYATGVVTGTGTDVEDHGIGGLVGYSSGYISGSHAEGNVIGSYEVGGLVGSTGGTLVNITNSYATGGVSGVDDVGGLVGLLDEAHTITNSYATGDVNGSGEYIGGLVGWLEAGAAISNSYATGDVTGTGTDEEDHGIGGLVGYSSGYISDSHAEGIVIGSDEVGGLVGSTGVATNITNSYATGNVSGEDDVGGLVGLLDVDHTITDSYATGDVTGDNNIGGLVGFLEDGATISNSYATGDVTGAAETEGGDAGGLVGLSSGVITNSHATGGVSGFFDVGGLVGDLQSTGSISNSYATGNVSATGTDGGFSDGWGGLVGESGGLISNSYATGNVVADFNYGSLIGYLALDEALELQILNSFATGSTTGGANGIEQINVGGVLTALDGLGGFVGCAVEDGSVDYSCIDSYKSFPETTPSILSVVNFVDAGEDPAFEIVACKNNGLPLISVLSASYTNTCTPNPAPASLSAALATAVQLNPKFNLLESTTLRLFLYLVGDNTIRITVEDFVVLGATGVNSKNLPVLLKLLKNVDLLTLDLNTINKNVKIANDLLKKQKKK